MANKINVVGTKINNMLVEGEYKGKDLKYILKMVCHCGQKFESRKIEITSSKKISCGCMNMGRKYKSKFNGESTTRIFQRYKAMIQRCEDVNFIHYTNYGGRGIKVCEQWRGDNGFFEFKKWSFENGYNETLSLDRINVNGNYEPSNCKYVTRLEQNLNKRNNWFEHLNGELVKVYDLVKKYDLNYSTLACRKMRGKSNDDLFIGLKCKMK